MALFIEILSSALIWMTPVLLAALGGLYTYHANVFNISMEGMMLTSAFLAVIGSFFTGSFILATLIAIVGTLLLSLLYHFLAVTLKVDEFITGLSINMLSLGGTTYLLRKLFGVKGAFQSPDIVPVPKLNIPFIDSIPIIGSVINNKNILVYLSIVIVFLVFYHIFYTVWGLRLRTMTEDPKVIFSIGISPKVMRLKAILMSGLLCALSGVALSLGSVTLFTENMSNGRGWIALVLIVMSRGNPIHILVTATLFGILDGFGLILQSVSIPPQITQMTPYIMTLIILYIYGRRKRIEGVEKNESYLGD